MTKLHVWNVLTAFAISSACFSPLWEMEFSPVFFYFFPSRLAFSTLGQDLAILVTVGGLLLILVPLLRPLALALTVLTVIWLGLLGIYPGWLGRNDGAFLSSIALCCGVVIFLILRSHQLRTALEWGALALFVLTLWNGIPMWRKAANLPLAPSRLGRVFFAQSSRPARIHTAQPIAKPKRLIWLLFDELDQRLTFEAGLRYPAFDRMAQESLQSTAMLPAHYRTMAAIPSMLTGKEYGLTEIGNDVPWGNDSLFALFEGRGRSTAVVGWYHPYCRVLGQNTSYCYTLQWDTVESENYLSGAPFSQRITGDFRMLGRQAPLIVPAYRALHKYQQTNSSASAPATPYVLAHREIFDRQQQVIDQVLDGPYGFVLLHLPIPHPPGIAINRSGVPSGDVLGNMTLADQTLASLRVRLESRGEWDSSVVLVTGDHHFRLDLWRDTSKPEAVKAMGGKEDPRTVFLLKLPADSTSAIYGAPFNGVLIHDLLDNIESGNLSGRAQVTQWLDSNRGRFRSTPPVRR